MKTLNYPIHVEISDPKKIIISFEKRTIYYLALVISVLLSFVFPMSIIAFIFLAISGIALKCHKTYTEITSINFSSEDYSITLEDIIDDLERK